VEVENFVLLLGGEDQWNPNGTVPSQTALQAFFHFISNRKYLIVYQMRRMASVSLRSSSNPSELM